MPLKRCESDGKSGWKWGDKGTCYLGDGAKDKAIAQGRSMADLTGEPFRLDAQAIGPDTCRQGRIHGIGESPPVVDQRPITLEDRVVGLRSSGTGPAQGRAATSRYPRNRSWTTPGVRPAWCLATTAGMQEVHLQDVGGRTAPGASSREQRMEQLPRHNEAE